MEEKKRPAALDRRALHLKVKIRPILSNWTISLVSTKWFMAFSPPAAANGKKARGATNGSRWRAFRCPSLGGLGVMEKWT
jgi:hypothetical protein